MDDNCELIKSTQVLTEEWRIFNWSAEIGDLQKSLIAETWLHMLTEVKISKAPIHTLEIMCLIKYKKDGIKFFIV